MLNLLFIFVFIFVLLGILCKWRVVNEQMKTYIIIGNKFYNNKNKENFYDTTPDYDMVYYTNQSFSPESKLENKQINVDGLMKNIVWENLDNTEFCYKDGEPSTIYRRQEKKVDNTSTGDNIIELQYDISKDRIPCPVDCKVTGWVNQGSCSKPCDGGIQIQTKDITEQAKHNGEPCPSLRQEVSCNTHPCPVDCVLGDFDENAWSSCSKSCGIGEQTTQREIVQSPANGGKDCNTVASEQNIQITKTKQCNTHSCDVDCLVSDWGGWSSCNKPCGSGTMSRQRSVTRNRVGNGAECPSPLTETKSCNTQECNPCALEVTDYTSCPAMCIDTTDSDTQTRTWKVTQESVGTGNSCQTVYSEMRGSGSFGGSSLNYSQVEYKPCQNINGLPECGEIKAQCENYGNCYYNNSKTVHERKGKQNYIVHSKNGTTVESREDCFSPCLPGTEPIKAPEIISVKYIPFQRNTRDPEMKKYAKTIKMTFKLNYFGDISKFKFGKSVWPEFTTDGFYIRIKEHGKSGWRDGYNLTNLYDQNDNISYQSHYNDTKTIYIGYNAPSRFIGKTYFRLPYKDALRTFSVVLVRKETKEGKVNYYESTNKPTVTEYIL